MTIETVLVVVIVVAVLFAVIASAFVANIEERIYSDFPEYDEEDF